MTRKSERTHSNSVTMAIEAAKSAAAGDIPVPEFIKLTDAEAEFWPVVTRARARAEWTDAELVMAGDLATCMAEIKAHKVDLKAEGSIMETARGTPVMNPRFAIIEQLTRRQVTLFRTLQMQATVNGKTARDMSRKRDAEAKARGIHAELATDERSEDSLLA